MSGEVERDAQAVDPDWVQLPVLLCALEGEDLRVVALNRGVLGLGIEVTESVPARQRAEAQSAEWEQRFATSQAAMSALQAALLPAEVPVLPGLQIGARYLLSEVGTARR